MGVTVPRGLPPSQDERLATVLRRMLPGAAGGQTRHIAPTGRANDRAPQYNPPAGSAYLPIRAATWEGVAISTATFPFSDTLLIRSYGSGWYTYSGAGHLVLTAPGLFHLTGTYTSSIAGADGFVDFSWPAMTESSAPNTLIVPMGTSATSAFFGSWSLVVACGVGADLNVAVNREGGSSMSEILVTASKIG